MVNATLEFTSPVNSGNMSIVTSIMIGALAPSPTESATSIPISIPTSIPTNPSQTGAQIFPGAEDEYPACAVCLQYYISDDYILIFVSRSLQLTVSRLASKVVLIRQRKPAFVVVLVC